MAKYELTSETRTFGAQTLYRIRELTWSGSPK